MARNWSSCSSKLVTSQCTPERQLGVGFCGSKNGLAELLGNYFFGAVSARELLLQLDNGDWLLFGHC